MQRPLFSSFAGLFLLAAPAQAFTVLVIDISDPAAVTFTSTGNVSLVNSSLNIGFDGFSIQNFLTSPATIGSGTQATGNLAPTGSTFVYAGLGSFDYEGGSGEFGSGNDLSVFSNGGGPGPASQVFSTTAAAFTGALTVNLSAYQSFLPLAGATGNVRAGFDTGTAGHGGIVGDYIVVPEPSSALLGGLGALALLKRRRKA